MLHLFKGKYLHKLHEILLYGSFIPQFIDMCVSHPVVFDPMRSIDYSPPGCSVHGIFQARLLEWVAIFSSRGSFQPKDWTWVSCVSYITDRFFTRWAIREGTIYLYSQSLIYLYHRYSFYFLGYNPILRSDQIRSVAQSCPNLCDPMNRSTPGLPVHHQHQEFTETHIHRVSDAIQPSHPRTTLF